MADEPNATPAPAPDGAPQTPPQPPAQTYNNDEVNAIVVKKEAAERAKTLKALGLSAEDEAWAKEAIAAAKAQKDAKKTTTDREGELAAELTAAQDALAQTTIEAQMLHAGVDPAKVGRAARLVDRAKCAGEDGKFSRDKAAAEIKEVLKDFPELLAAKQTAAGQKLGLDMSGSQAGGEMTLEKAIQLNLKTS
jgi:multidrug efflux pump subunit AcrA (membrane-fusion protein)